MSTREDAFPVEMPTGLLSSNTIAESIRREEKDRRQEPEDMRSRRFGYNPAMKMSMDPVHSGLQTREVPAGCLVLFETGPVSRQKHSVDKDDRTPPNEIVDFLAGEGLGNLYHQFSGMGFRELLPLRGMTDDQALRLFYAVHPPLVEAVQRNLIPKCIYEMDVCITCRYNLLLKLSQPEFFQRIPEAARSTFTLVKESVTVGRAHMAGIWRTAVSEVAGVKAGTNRRMALGAITEDHMFFMRHLHERTPDDMELAKIAANAEAQANVMTMALAEQSKMLAATLQANNQNRATANSEENAELRERLRVLEGQLGRLLSLQSLDPDVPDAPAE